MACLPDITILVGCVKNWRYYIDFLTIYFVINILYGIVVYENYFSVIFLTLGKNEKSL